MLWNQVSPIPLPPPIPAPLIARLAPWIFIAASSPIIMCSPSAVPKTGMAFSAGIKLNTNSAFIVHRTNKIESPNACKPWLNLCVGIVTSRCMMIASYAPITIPSAIAGPIMSPVGK